MDSGSLSQNEEDRGTITACVGFVFSLAKETYFLSSITITGAEPT